MVRVTGALSHKNCQIQELLQGSSFVLSLVRSYYLTFLDNSIDKVSAESVAEMAVVGNVEDEEIGLFVGMQAADLMGKADGLGGVDGGGGDGLGRGEPHIATG